MKKFKPNSTNIDWADFTLNPIVGCNYGCKYCYAKTLNDRFKFVKDWSKPEFFPERLNFYVPKMPKNRNPIAAQLSPDKPIVFVESMGDIAGFDDEEPDSPEYIWASKITEVCSKHDEAIFFFVSKREYTLARLSYLSANMYLGITMPNAPTKLHDYAREQAAIIIKAQGAHVFANIEPIQGSFAGVDLSAFEFAIVGPETGNRKGIYVPTKEEILSVKHEKVYYKKGVYDLYPELK